MKYNQYQIKERVWLYPGKARSPQEYSPIHGSAAGSGQAGSWHFVTIPTDISEDITKNFGNLKRGWGSLPVLVTIDATTWKTSIFPDKKSNTYLLPIKGEVRQSEKIAAEDQITLLIEIKV